MPSCFEASLRKPEPTLARSFQTREHTPPSESVHCSAVLVGAAVPGGRGGVMCGGKGGGGGGARGARGRGSGGQGFVQPQAGQGEVVGQVVEYTGTERVVETYRNVQPTAPVHVFEITPDKSVTVDRVQPEGHVLMVVATDLYVTETWLLQTALPA